MIIIFQFDSCFVLKVVKKWWIFNFAGDKSKIRLNCKLICHVSSKALRRGLSFRGCVVVFLTNYCFQDFNLFEKFVDKPFSKKFYCFASFHTACQLNY